MRFKLKIKAPKIKIKTGIKAIDNATKAAGSLVKTVGKGVEKVGQGNISGGVGDITQSFARTGLDVVTGGNKNLVDGATGGALTSLELAARGNSKDLIRVGSTAAAAYVGGPNAALAVNQSYANGGDFLDGVFSSVGLPNPFARSSYSSGDFLEDPVSYISQNKTPIFMIAAGVGILSIVAIVLIKKRRK